MNKECEKVKKFISDYIDGNLASREHKYVADHITTCDECRQAVSETSHLVSQLADMSGNSVGFDLWPAVAGRIAEQKRKSGFWDRMHTALQWKTFAIPGVALAAGLIFVAVKPINSPAPPKPKPAVARQQVSAECKAYFQAYSGFRGSQPLADRGAIDAAEQLNRREAIPN